MGELPGRGCPRHSPSERGLLSVPCQPEVSTPVPSPCLLSCLGENKGVAFGTADATVPKETRLLPGASPVLLNDTAICPVRQQETQLPSPQSSLQSLFPLLFIPLPCLPLLRPPAPPQMWAPQQALKGLPSPNRSAVENPKTSRQWLPLGVGGSRH